EAMVGVERGLGKDAEFGIAARMLRPRVCLRGGRRYASLDCRRAGSSRRSEDVLYLPRLNFLEDARGYGRCRIWSFLRNAEQTQGLAQMFSPDGKRKPPFNRSSEAGLTLVCRGARLRCSSIYQRRCRI